MDSLTPADRQVIKVALEEIESTPPATDLRTLGWPVAVLGVVLLVGWPRLAELVPIAMAASGLVLLMGIAMVVLGPLAALTAGGSARGTAAAAVEAALRRLESGGEDREVLLRAATLLLAMAHVTEGPTTTRSFRTEDVTPRLGGALALVLAVEAYLVVEEGIHPVFHDPEDRLIDDAPA
jgi:hypothetical protein